MPRPALLALSLLTVATAASASTASLNGTWTRSDGSVKTRIAPCGGNVCAVNTWVRDPNGDERVGDQLVMTLSPSAGGTLTGTGHDVRRNMNVNLTITTSPGRFTSRGCLIGGVLCRSASWTAAK